MPPSGNALTAGSSRSRAWILARQIVTASRIRGVRVNNSISPVQLIKNRLKAFVSLPNIAVAGQQADAFGAERGERVADHEVIE